MKYTVKEEFDEKGKWKGYRVWPQEAQGKVGKLYPRTDGRENYQSPPIPKPEKKDNDEELDLL